MGKPKEKQKDNLDGCGVDFIPVKDEIVEALLVPKGKEHSAWTEKQEQEDSDGA